MAESNKVLFVGVAAHNHRCARVENPGEGVAQIFAWGDQGFPDKIARGSPILAFIAF
jgi:hypothetical protein